MTASADTPRITVEPSSPAGPAAPPQPAAAVPRIAVPPAGAPAALQREALLEQYAILDRIGGGGMGVVYLARDRKLGRHVAVKRLHAAALGRDDLKTRFLREARAIAALNHIHIVHVYALGEDADGPYIVMEYVPGPSALEPLRQPPAPCSLADKINAEGPLPPDAAVRLILKICSAVEYAHGRGVIHRDLKPSNVLLDVSNEPKIVDFGLARRTDPEDERLTMPGEKMLSLGYGAPEQERDASTVDERADVYGLGAVLYFSLTGQNPRYFREADIPEALRAPLNKALKTDRDQRWATAAEFAGALEAVYTPATVMLPAGKTTWRCTWCEMVNPIAISYCGECGWDGREWCLECGVETRVGIPFCGSCGADRRQYEAARRLCDRLHTHRENRAYERIAQYAGRISRFQPAGPNGRRLLQDAHDLCAEAERILERRSTLHAAIAREFGAGNYESAQRLIREYDTLAADRPFSEQVNRIPDLIRQRDLDRVRSLVRHGAWAEADRLGERIARQAGPLPEETAAALRSLRRHRMQLGLLKGAAWAAGLFVLYLAAAPLLYRVTTRGAPGVARTLNAPFDWLRARTVLRAPLRAWVRFVGAEHLYYAPTAPAPAVGVLHAPEGPPAAAAEVVELLAAYGEDIEAIEARARALRAAWPNAYIQDLVALMHTLQKAGDFEGWEAARWELQRFESDPTLPDRPPAALPDVIRAFQEEQRRAVADIEDARVAELSERARVAVADLGTLQMAFTKAGKMNIAAAVNTEIKRLRTRIIGTPAPPDGPQADVSPESSPNAPDPVR
jgi:serine/threonine protein kinase